MRKLLLASVAAFAMSALASAAVQVTVGSPSVTGPVAGIWTWSYDVTLGSGDIIRQDDFFTIYDAYNLTNPQSPNADWDVLVVNTGITPPTQGPTDSPLYPNVTFTYNNPTPYTTQGSLGLFTFQSTSGIINHGTFFSSQSTGSDVGQQPNYLTTFTDVPGDPNSTAPEPATMGLMGGACLGLAAMIRRRKA